MDVNDYDQSPLIAELYDSLTPRDADVSFYLQAASDYGGPILELACGTGRILLAIARAGFDIAGLDLSARMLETCRARLACEPASVRERVTLHCSPMQSFNLGRKFRLVIIPFHSFQFLLTTKDQLACLSAVRGHLEPTGRLVLDLFVPPLGILATPPNGEATAEEAPIQCTDGRTVRRRQRVVERDLLHQISTSEMIYDITHADARTEQLVHRHCLRYLFRFEAEHLLARAGFCIEHQFAGFDRTPLSADVPVEFVFIAQPTEFHMSATESEKVIAQR
jgi:SAM-dependent methyltransferase